MPVVMTNAVMFAHVAIVRGSPRSVSIRLLVNDFVPRLRSGFTGYRRLRRCEKKRGRCCEKKNATDVLQGKNSHGISVREY
jgi:hypothetical protein